MNKSSKSIERQVWELKTEARILMAAGTISDGRTTHAKQLKRSAALMALAAATIEELVANG